MSEQATELTGWTIAFRKPRANRFLRVTNWSGTWAQAYGMARLFAEANPELQVYYVSSVAAEQAGRVVAEDVGNILSETTGRRVRIVEGGELPAEMIARIPAADIARERWSAGEPVADPAPTAAEVAEHEQLMREGAAIREANAREQVEAWWKRHGLDEHETITAELVLAARDADLDEALHVEATALLGQIAIDGRPAAVTRLLEVAELETDCAEHLQLVRRAVALDRELRPRPRQAPAACLHAGCHPGRCVYGYAVA